MDDKQLAVKITDKIVQETYDAAIKKSIGGWSFIRTALEYYESQRPATGYTLEQIRAENVALKEIFAQIWGLALTDCGPEEYHLFPQMLKESFDRASKYALTAESERDALKARAEAAEAPVSDDEFDLAYEKSRLNLRGPDILSLIIAGRVAAAQKGKKDDESD